MLVGAAVSVTLGGAAGVTVTVTDFETLPPAPVHVSVYVPVVFNPVNPSEPDVALAPLHTPDAAHDVLFVLVHARVDDAL